MRRFVGFLVILVGAAIIFWFYQSKVNGSILNPLSSLEIKKTRINPKYKVVGFLPSWNVGKTINYCDEINELIFLGIEVKETGDLVWDVQAKKINNESYIKQKNDFKRCGGKNILGIKLFDDDKIATLLANESAKSNLIEQIQAVSKDNNFDGINLDFEYQGNPTAILEDEFFGLVSQLRQTYKGEIGVDVFANTIIKGDEIKLKRMVDNIDELIVMAYDFHRPGVDYAGAVAPINSPIGERNILEVSQKAVDLGMNKKKMVLAYPLYGYEWKTETAEFGSRVKRGWYAMASYKRVKELMADADFMKTASINWDETSMTPWISYVEDGVIHQIYYDNLESLSRKIKLATDGQFLGVGFWALGYEGENLEVWKETKKLTE